MKIHDRHTQEAYGKSLTIYDYLTGSSGTLAHYVRAWASAPSDSLFCEMAADGHTTSYRELDTLADAISNALSAARVEQADAVAVYMQNRPEYAALMIGVQRAGAVLVPCSTHSAADELKYQLAHVSARIAFVDAETWPVMRSVLPDCPTVRGVVMLPPSGPSNGVVAWDDFLATGVLSSQRSGAPVAADDIAMVMYTSGTTARPKGIVFSHGHLVAAGLRKLPLLDWSRDDRFLHFFPMYHANGSVSSLVPTILAGASLVLMPSFSPTRFAEDLVRHRITLCNVNGTHVKMILNTPESESDAKHAVRRMYLGLAPEEPVVNEFQHRFRTILLPGYGLTECLTALGTSVRDERPAGSIGRPARGISLRITAPDGEDVPTDGVGEIRLRGDFRHELSAGYYLDDKATAEAYEDGWLRTGDLGRVNQEGFVWYEGRLKDVIKRSGYTIGAAEVERVITQVPGVVDCAVVGTPDRMREEAIVAFVVWNGESQVSPQAVIDACRSNLANYKVPQFVVDLPSLPRDVLGKVDRKALRTLAQRYAVTTSERTPLGGPVL